MAVHECVGSHARQRPGLKVQRTVSHTDGCDGLSAATLGGCVLCCLPKQGQGGHDSFGRFPLRQPLPLETEETIFKGSVEADLITAISNLKPSGRGRIEERFKGNKLYIYRSVLNHEPRLAK